jgi:cobalt-zinc-cadmium efflux system outer membrane protein
VTGSLASRTGGASRATNWSVTLAQELEIAGQSGLRVDTAHGELEAQRHQVAVVRADVAEQVWLAYFEALAAKERAALAARAERAAAAVSLTVQGMAAQGLTSSIDAAVADAAAVRASRTRLEAERERGASELRLRTLLSAPATVEVGGTLEPLAFKAEAAAARPEQLALEALRLASARRVELLRRSRAPNPTLSLFAQNDGFDERVFGVGLGFPIPLPQPVGRTHEGEIAEAAGVEARLQAELQQLRRRVDSEQALARAAWDTSLQARALYSPERLERARAGLTAIAEQLAAARIPVREALVSQQALVELLQAEVGARHELCVASVRLVRASGGSLEGGGL